MAGEVEFDDLVPDVMPTAFTAASPSPAPPSPAPISPAAHGPAVPGASPGFGSVLGRAAVRGLEEGVLETKAGAEITGRAMTGEQAFRPDMLPEAPDDDITRLLGQKFSEGWNDPNWWAAHIAHGAARSSPTLGLGLAGAAGGTAVAPGVGTVVGGLGGLATGGVIQTLAPAYSQARQEGLGHDAAVDRALRDSGIAGVFSAAMGLAPGASAFGRTAEGALKKPISEALFQIFGAQPALGAGQQVAIEASHGRLPTLDDLATGYATNAGMGLSMTAAHQGAARMMPGRREAATSPAVNDARVDPWFGDLVPHQPGPDGPALTVTGASDVTPSAAWGGGDLPTFSGRSSGNGPPPLPVEAFPSAEATAGERPPLPGDPRYSKRRGKADAADAQAADANPPLTALDAPVAGVEVESAALPVNPGYLKTARALNARRAERGQAVPRQIDEPAGVRPAAAAEQAIVGAGWRSQSDLGAESGRPLSPDYSHVVVTPDGSMQMATRPEVVELASLTRAAGDLQPRDRNRAEYQREAAERAVRLDPLQLQPGRVSDSGSPIAMADGTVLSGNGRVLSIAETYSNPALKAQADAYRASLGPAAEGMREPVLVLRAPEISRDQAVRFADLSNRTRIAEMSATERAQRDAKALGDVVDLYRGGDFDSMDNAAFLRAFVENVVPPAERPSISANGQLSREGAERMRGAVLAAAYDDPGILMRMLESTDDNIRNVTHALTDAAPAMAGLRQEVAAGRIPAELDATPALMEAARLISDLRARRVPVSEYFAQSDAFGRDPLIETWVRAFYHEDLSRAKARGDMAAVIRAYADEALHHQSGGLFADETTAADVLGSARRVARPSTGTGGDLAPAAGDLGQGVPEGRAGAGKRADDPGRAATREGSGAALGEFAAGYGAKAAKDAAKAEEADVAPSAAKLAAVNTALRLGRPVAIPPHVVQQSHAALAPLTHMAPEGTRIGMLSRLEPVARHPNGADTRAVFVTPDGDWFTVTAPRSTLLGVRAFRTLDNDIAFLRFDLAGDLGRALGGELGHEVVHVLRAQGRIPEESWGALVGHAEGLRLLESDYRTYLQGIGNRDYRLVPAGVSGREIYDRLYGARPDKAEVMAQEAVAHMVELYHHGGLLPQEVGPVRGLLDDILSGAMARGEARGEAGYGTGMEAAQGRSRVDALGFSSRLDDVLAGLRPTDMVTADTLRKRGVKDSEMAARGLSGLLADGKAARVSDLETVSGNNRVAVSENAYVTRRALAEMKGKDYDRLNPSERDMLDSHNRLVKWQNYSLDPKNDTYRETVLHLGDPREAQYQDILARMRAIEEAPRTPTNQLSDESGWMRLAKERDRLRAEIDNDAFKSGHWSEPNVVAHARTGMYRDTNRRDVFLIDELQSDWGQKIRDRGGPRDTATMARIREALAAMPVAGDDYNAVNALQTRWTGKVDHQHDWNAWPPSVLADTLQQNARAAVAQGSMTDREAAEVFSLAMRIVERPLLEAEYRTAEAGTPGHPLVNTTDQWTTTAMRRLIRQAVESGADQIAFTPGRVQAQRFNLAKQIDALAYDPERQFLYFKRRGHNVFDSATGSREIAPDQLPEFVGKELAAQLLKAPMRAPEPGTGFGGSKSVHFLGDLNANIGGEGMRATYDQMYPRTLGKILGKIDPAAKMTETTLRFGEPRVISKIIEQDFGERVTPEAIERASPIFEHEKAIGARTLKVVSFPLTEKIKAAVIGEGQPLFAAGPGSAPPRAIDSMGYYSGALDAAHRLRQAKGTPEQMLVMLGKEGAKKGEIEATGLDKFLEGKVSVTKDEIVKYLEENRIGLNEVKYRAVRTDEQLNAEADRLVEAFLKTYPSMNPRHVGDMVDGWRWEGVERPNDDVSRARQSVYDLAPSHIQRMIDDLRGGQADAKWSSYSLDPSNPTYRETVLHLPLERRMSFDEFRDAYRKRFPNATDVTDADVRSFYDKGIEVPGVGQRITQKPDVAFQSGHFPEPNITGHLMTSMTKHEGKPVYTIDQIQSDWGQKLRDGGVRDEAKIAELKKQFQDAQDLLHVKAQARKAIYAEPTTTPETPSRLRSAKAEEDAAQREYSRIRAELATAEAATTGHPLVNTTDQWTNTTLRRAIRQAAEADADYIAIPHGDTVLSYNPGDDRGMWHFYGSKGNPERRAMWERELEAAKAAGDTQLVKSYEQNVRDESDMEGIIPKNLRKLLGKLDRDTPPPLRVNTLETPSGQRGFNPDRNGDFDPERTGFTLFPLTDKAKRTIMEGYPLFASGGAIRGV